jgi:hypothetical protein
VTSAAIGYTGTIWLNRAVAATPTEARMKSMLVAILVALAAPPAWAASAPPIVRKTPNLAKDAEAFPTLVGATTAIARINRALQAANAEQLDEMKDCLRDAPQDGYCEGFRMPAQQQPLGSSRDRAGVRKPPRNETASRKGVDVADAAYGDLRTASVCFRAVGTTVERCFDGLSVARQRLSLASRSGSGSCR